MSDHDLLIELRTEMRAVRNDLREMKDNTSRRVDFLESQKEDKTEVQRLLKEANKIHDDHEARLRDLEDEQNNFRGKYIVISALSVMVVSAVISWLVNQVLL